MTSPCEVIEVRCPRCEHVYTTAYRASINAGLDPDLANDPEYLEKVTTGTCPECGHKVSLGSLVVRPGPDGAETWELG